MSEHTKEPWEWCVLSSYGRLAVPDSYNDVHGYVAIFKTGEKKEVASIDYLRDANTTHANARRIVACVNACAGVPTEALERAAECAEHGVIPTLAAQYRAERDALRYAMQELIDAKKREVFTVEVEANTEDELMNAWTEMHSYWCAAETAIIKSVTP